jgi:hypothetical protein
MPLRQGDGFRFVQSILRAEAAPIPVKSLPALQDNTATRVGRISRRRNPPPSRQTDGGLRCANPPYALTQAQHIIVTASAGLGSTSVGGGANFAYGICTFAGGGPPTLVGQSNTTTVAAGSTPLATASSSFTLLTGRYQVGPCASLNSGTIDDIEQMSGVVMVTD